MPNFDHMTVKVETYVRTDRQKGWGGQLWEISDDSVWTLKIQI